ncbi:MAG: galactokinase [Clostridia bacterium]|nr:galactokinase [Clostridia bacterium]
MNAQTLKENILSGALDVRFAKLYGSDEDVLASQRARYAALIDEFASRYGADRDIALFSVPGRSELSGNHTDHNHGCVIAGSIDLDIIAVAAKNEDSTVRIKSEGFPEDVVDIDTFNTPVENRFGKSDALIAGVADGFRARGYKVGGYDACTTSSVLKGSGLSSSAAFENMVGLMLSHFYNEGSVDFVTLAQISQYSENKFFGKPCGLMDQVACAAGGIVSIDFADTAAPIVEKVDFDLTEAGYCLCIVNTGGNHADLTPDYAAVPAEMKAVAAELGATVLRETDREALMKNIAALREKVGDRAILRALHFFAENDRVAEQKSALKSGDLEKYFAGVLSSGRSSFCYLQNVYTTANVSEQGISLALNLCESFLSKLDKPTAWRVHGGGFAGTVQAYVPTENAQDFVKLLESVFGEGSCYLLHIRLSGAVKVF